MKFHVFLLCLSLMTWGSLRADLDYKEYIQAGMAHMEEGDYESAVYAFQKVLETNSEMPQIYNALGVAYLHLEGTFQDALRSFEEAIRLKPDYAEAYFNVGLSYAQYRGDPLSAKEYFQKTIERDSHFTRAYHSLGLVYMMEENNPEKAAEYFLKTIELSPDFAQAHFSLGVCYIMMGKRSEVLGPITRLRELENEKLALTLESMLRGEGLPVRKEPPGAPQPSEEKTEEFDFTAPEDIEI